MLPYFAHNFNIPRPIGKIWHIFKDYTLPMKARLEKITSPPQGSFKMFHYENKEFDAPWHFHPEFELTHIVSGGGIRYVGDSVMEFEAGDLVLLGANLPHCWKSTGASDALAKSIVVQWKEELLGTGWLDKNEFKGIQKLLVSASRGLQFGPENVDNVLALMHAMDRQAPFDKILSLLNVLHILSKDPNCKFLSGDNFSAKLNHRANQRINLIHDFVGKNYQHSISLAQISDLVNMGEETFCRFFKRTFNKTFFTFLNEYKIKLACKLLIESDQQVTEIAFQSGYESLPFFYRQFNKFMGCSPLAYRQKYRRAFVE